MDVFLLLAVQVSTACAWIQMRGAVGVHTKSRWNFLSNLDVESGAWKKELHLCHIL